jgi:hypothetical protein
VIVVIDNGTLDTQEMGYSGNSFWPAVYYSDCHCYFDQQSPQTYYVGLDYIGIEVWVDERSRGIIFKGMLQDSKVMPVINYSTMILSKYLNFQVRQPAVALFNI